MRKDGKTIYAQSSDIKSRTYLEYRKDMKSKAIAELEVLEWLENKMIELNPKSQVKVYKSGGDKFLWFLRRGGISREPDFIAEIDNKKEEIEFQYVDADINNFYFNFKTSKVIDRKGIPKQTKFLCMLQRSPEKFAFIKANWIKKIAKQTTEPAWGNRNVYRIEKKEILNYFKDDESLPSVWRKIDAKKFILIFQHELIDITKDKLSYLLQSVIDENKIIEITPKDLDSFFKVCFILDNINKIPQNTNLWLVYLLSYINDKIYLEDVFKITYSIDFLYSKIELKQNELVQLVNKVKELLIIIKRFYCNDGSYRSSLKSSPLEETRYALFSINLLEDLIQDLLFYYPNVKLEPIKKIYESVDNIENTYKLLKCAK